MNAWNSLLLIASLTVLGACDRTSAPLPPSADAVPAVPAAWLGRWQGPEGTWLEISGGPGSYRLVVSNLDGPRSFDAKEGSAALVFVRDGVTETVRAGTGPETGMKWLAEKRDCLIVKTGEGYCRD